MLVKLTNSGSGARILYDVNGQSRSVVPGGSLTVDLVAPQVAKLERAYRDGDKLMVERLAVINEGEKSTTVLLAEPTYTLKEGEGLARKPVMREGSGGTQA